MKDLFRSDKIYNSLFSPIWHIESFWIFALASSFGTESAAFDEFEHYRLNTGPVDEFGSLTESKPTIRNVGWTLGNECPYRCTHCYSMNARLKGQNMTPEIIARVVDQLAANGIETVNLGGNEPLFTNGPKPQNTLLPHIIHSLHKRGIEVGLTTSGITLLRLYEDHRDAFELLNDVDVSFDSPFAEEHNVNRGAKLFNQALRALEICQQSGKASTCIMCAMSWNFSTRHIDALVDLARRYGANVRINPIKPVKPEHMQVTLSPDQYYHGFSRLMALCDPVDLGEPPIAAVTNFNHAKRCPCGRTSFRIHSISPDGKIYISPCVYLHDFKSPLDLMTNDLADIIASSQFRLFRQRNANPEHVTGCTGCDLLGSCGGGCAARSYLHHFHETGRKTMLAQDPYCPKKYTPAVKFPNDPQLVTDQRLVHMDYLCTWIGRPKP